MSGWPPSSVRWWTRRGQHHAYYRATELGSDPAPSVAAEIFDGSGGNAYLVEELAGTIRDDSDVARLSPSVRDVLLSRVDALSLDAQRLLRAAAVGGRTVADLR
jgi:hypothetical protein